MSDPIMTREEVAEYLDISPDSVRSAMRRAQIQLKHGYLRRDVLKMQRAGQGHRSDLRKETDMAQLTRDTHTWNMETRDHPRSPSLWRWVCGCGSRGRWQVQSPSASSYAWAKHAGVEPFTVDEYGRPE